MEREDIEQLVFCARLARLAIEQPRDAETQRIIAQRLDDALKPFEFVRPEKKSVQSAAA